VAWAIRRRTAAQALRRARFRLSRRTTVVCLGDSHAEVFEHVDVPGYAFDVYMVEGATASGVENPNSKTQAGTQFRARLAKARRDQPVVVLLGEVDCGFVIWYRAQRHGTSADEELARTVGGYASFLADVRPTVVVSAPPPTIVDGQTWGDVANARSEIAASQRERTELTLRFNDAVRDVCAREGIAFCDVTPRMLGDDGLIAERFRDADPLDHHLDSARYAELLAPALLRSLDARD
jgi:hypothetical protein